MDFYNTFTNYYNHYLQIFAISRNAKWDMYEQRKIIALLKWKRVAVHFEGAQKRRWNAAIAKSEN